MEKGITVLVHQYYTIHKRTKQESTPYIGGADWSEIAQTAIRGYSLEIRGVFRYDAALCGEC